MVPDTPKPGGTLCRHLLSDPGPPAIQVQGEGSAREERPGNFGKREICCLLNK